MKRFLGFLAIVVLLLAGCGKEEAQTFQASAIVEGTAIKVSAQTGGYLVKVYVDEGDDVVMGQTIALVDTEKLGYELERVQANLEDLAVQRRIAAANVRRARDDYDYARTKYERYQSLYRTNAAPEQLLDDLKIGFKRARIGYEQAQQRLASVASKEKALQAQVKLLRRRIRDAVVKAPLSGTITARYYDTGETIPPNAPVVEIIDLSEMWAKVYVSETYLPKIKIGQKAEVKVDGSDRTLVGKVAWISSKAEFTPKNILTQESRTSLVYAVKIIVPNPQRILKHGMPVSITLHTAA